MVTRQFGWRSALALLSVVLSTAIAGAQALDFPTLKGDNARTGKNADPKSSTPGLGYLGWFGASGYTTKSQTVVIDNTDFINTSIAPFLGGPYDSNTRGSASSSPTVSSNNDPSNTWASTTELTEASFPYLEFRRVFAVGRLKSDYSLRNPAYFYTNATPSAAGSDPTIAATPGDLRTFTWTFSPVSNVAPYASISVWLPIGPTHTNLNGPNDLRYPQRYFVYEVDYGTSGKYVEVVDSYLAGSGWYRFGRLAGNPNLVFPYDGVNPITVKLYNTVPRDSTTGLLLEKINGVTLQPLQESQVKNRLVYADAVQMKPSFGSISATPASATLLSGTTNVTAAINQSSAIVSGNTLTTLSKGIVLTYPKDNLGAVIGAPTWQFSPLEESIQGVNVDNTAANLAGFTSEATPATHQGADYSYAAISTVAPSATATYAPTLSDGAYQIYAFLPGSATGRTFGSQVEVDIYEGTTKNKVYVDQASARGWVQIGTRRYTNATKTTGPLKVVVTNFSPTASDGTKFAYADAIRFVGAADLQILSSPIHARVMLRKAVGSALVSTDVVVVADEKGVIHCLDAAGNANGSTTEYWSYPSTPDQNNSAWFDPNLDATKDTHPISNGIYDGTGGTLLAEMPTGFNLSSGLVQSIGGNDYLFIASSNGRIYCLSMAGRGDFNAQTSVPGTTQRVWTYPATYPSPVVVKTSNLGNFVGSVSFAQLSSGANALFVPSPQGRIFALNALPGDTSGTTTPIWTYPSLNNATLGAINSTPSVDAFGQGAANLKIYFGTARKNDSNGEFYCLNANTGALVWTVNAENDPQAGTVAFDDFLSSPATVSKTILDGVPASTGNPPANADTVYALNQNRYLYAFDANTGNLIWQSNELSVTATGALTFSVMTAYNANYALQQFPIIVIPATSGHFFGLFARLGDLNVYGTRLAWGHPTEGDSITASISNSNLWLYGGDSQGFLYAFNNTPGDFTNGSGGFEPGGGVDIVPDSPTGHNYGYAKVRLITPMAYQKLRLATGSNPDYTNGTSVALADPRTSQKTIAFDWGETAYVQIYDFPFETTKNGQVVLPPIINVSISVEGKVIRNVAVESRQFSNAAASKQIGGVTMDGYGVLAFTFQGSGPNSLPPGNAEIKITISSSSLAGSLGSQEVELNPATGPNPNDPNAGYSRLDFAIANPLGVAMTDPTTGITSAITSLGKVVDPADPQSLVNGSPIIGAVPYNQLQQSTGPIPHGQSKKARVYVYDRSLMTLIRPDGQGIDGVRIDRKDLGWQGGSANVYRPLSASLYPNFEDLPTNFPNDSLDYPDVKREQISVIKDPNGSVENPLFNSVSLNAPMIQNSDGTLRPINSNDTITTRLMSEVLQPTIFDFQVDVPKFQPANTAAFSGALANSAGLTSLPQGYTGRTTVFVDSVGNGILDNINNRSAYRSFNLSIAVPPDLRLSVATPNVDLGSLASGYGYTPLPASSTPNYPWDSTNPWYSKFTEFQVKNEGNVNLLDLRIAKSSNLGTFTPWGIYSAANDPLAFLDSTFDVWSDMDATFAPTIGPNYNHVILQKARVSDLVPTTLSVNPVARANDKLGLATDTPLLNTALYPVRNPRVSVTVPFGLPVGHYKQTMRVIENDFNHSNETLDALTNNVLEAYSDPGFDLSFTVKEARLTNGSDAGGALVADSMAQGYTNAQPAAYRDGNGALVMAWTSNRPAQSPTPATPSANPTEDSWRIFLAGMTNATKFQQSSYTPPAGSSPLSDLNAFVPQTTGSWMRPSDNSTSGYPNLSSADQNTLFGVGVNESLLANSVRYGAPAFPANGTSDPLNQKPVASSVQMAFIGTAQKLTSTGILTDSRIFVSSVSIDSSAKVTATAPTLVAADDTVLKGKPAVTQLNGGSNAVMIYPGVAGGSSSLYVANYPTTDPAHNGQPLNFGNGFSSIDSPSIATRLYQGFDPNITLNGAATVPGIVELTFTAKLMGQPNSEVFMGRLRLNQLPKVDPTEDPSSTDLPNTRLAEDAQHRPQPFVYLPVQTRERLVASGAPGTFRTRGVYWNLASSGIELVQVVNGVTTNILMNGVNPSGQYVAANDTRVYDRQTGLIVYDTRLGGKVIIDPNLGTFRFTTSIPSPQAELRATYQPRFIRVNQGGSAAYASANGMFDNRYISDPLDLNGTSYVWRTQAGVPTSAGAAITNDRMMFIYNQSASGAGLASRPYMTTMRFGVRLLSPIFVPSNGTPTTVTVTGNRGPYQIDPVKGRIYFTAVDEDNVVSVTYTPLDGATGGPATSPITVQTNVTYVIETRETQVALDSAVNESGVSAFIDPFTYLAQPRPPLTWLFWTSTRNGSPDIYFQTIAPQFLARPASGN